MNKLSYPGLVTLLACLVILLFGLSVAAGQVWINPLALWGAELSSQQVAAERLILQEIRIPRALLGLMVGAVLGLSGAVLQGLLRNPLAEPGLLGVSAAASLGAVFAVYSGLTALFAYALPLSALLVALGQDTA